MPPMCMFQSSVLSSLSHCVLKLQCIVCRSQGPLHISQVQFLDRRWKGFAVETMHCRVCRYVSQLIVCVWPLLVCHWPKYIYWNVHKHACFVIFTGHGLFLQKTRRWYLSHVTSQSHNEQTQFTENTVWVWALKPCGTRYGERRREEPE
jgi:hypothetical protein